MRNKRSILGILTLAGLIAQTGCEVGNDGGSGETFDPNTGFGQSTPTNSAVAAAAAAAVAPAAATTAASLDELDISNATALGTHSDKPAQDARITKLLYVANKEGDHVTLSFDTLNWPTQGGGKKVDGGVYIYWVEGSRVIGGLFDFHGVGQKSKTLENIYDGYLSGHRPPRGAPVWFTIVSLDGSRRTNVKRSNSTW